MDQPQVKSNGDRCSQLRCIHVASRVLVSNRFGAGNKRRIERLVVKMDTRQVSYADDSAHRHFDAFEGKYNFKA